MTRERKTGGPSSNLMERPGAANYMRVPGGAPWNQRYVFIDDFDRLYCEGEFDKLSLTYCEYTHVYEKDEDEDNHLHFIFCKVRKRERALFEEAMVNLDRRLEMLRGAAYLEVRGIMEKIINGEDI